MTGFEMDKAEILPLTDECLHWTRLSEVPFDLQKYWQQRYTIFPDYDEGIYMTHDAWFGVTPEPVAINLTADFLDFIGPDKTTVIDTFSGVGGNSIRFALATQPDGVTKRFDRIIAIERDAATLACAQHNASLYMVEDRITWIHGDSFEYLKLLREAPHKLGLDLRVDTNDTAIFASPPWGGPGYTSDAIFDLHTMEPYSLSTLHDAYNNMDHALYLPRTSDLRQLAKLVPDDFQEKIDVVQYCIRGASKAMVAYLPARLTESVDESSSLSDLVDQPTKRYGRCSII